MFQSQIGRNNLILKKLTQLNITSGVLLMLFGLVFFLVLALSVKSLQADGTYAML